MSFGGRVAITEGSGGDITVAGSLPLPR